MIQNTYEIVRELGAGGSGIVYLANHTRLEKQVILKADKRSRFTKMEAFRREVDAMKNLRHPNIPQVYDFFQEDGTNYTVMDYVPGESLDKPLKEGKAFSQQEILRWTRQLLESLVYLHTRPPHGILHGDMKPANVMVTPQGDVALIDFNIALALGDSGAVAVGRSFGYASPEHYATAFQEETDTTTTAGEPVYLDVRSDIYGLGATLYHLVSGVRPDKDATAVAPLVRPDFNPQFLAIITRSMAPEPQDRFQSAQEMLDAVLALWHQDSRLIGHKKLVTKTAVALALAGVLGGCLTTLGLYQIGKISQSQEKAAQAMEALAQGDRVAAQALALEADWETAQSQEAMAAAFGTYDLLDRYEQTGKVALDSHVTALALSPDGRLGAAVADFQVTVFETATGQIVKVLPGVESALAQVVFFSDTTLAYCGQSGLVAYDCVNLKPLWQGELATALALSEDGKTLAAVYRDQGEIRLYREGKAQVIDLGEDHQWVPGSDRLTNPNTGFLALNADGSQVALSLENGAVGLYDDQGSLLAKLENPGCQQLAGGFSQEYLAVAASGDGHSVLTVMDTQNMEITGTMEDTIPMALATDNQGIYVAMENTIVTLNPITGGETELAYTGDQEVAWFAKKADTTLVLTQDGGYQVFQNGCACQQKGGQDTCQLGALAPGRALVGGLDFHHVKILEEITKEDCNLGTYDPEVSHMEAKISADFQYVMIYDVEKFGIYHQGKLVKSAEFPDSQEIYDQQYEDDTLEITYFDGTTAIYDGKSGALLRQTQGAEIDKTLTEKFTTDLWRVVAPLEGPPQVYDSQSGREIATLDTQDYMTDLTQVGSRLVAQYLDGDGSVYGVIYNEKGETLATVPGLCQVVGEMLVVDTGKGELRGVGVRE